MKFHSKKNIDFVCSTKLIIIRSDRPVITKVLDIRGSSLKNGYTNKKINKIPVGEGAGRRMLLVGGVVAE